MEYAMLLGFCMVCIIIGVASYMLGKANGRIELYEETHK